MEELTVTQLSDLFKVNGINLIDLTCKEIEFPKSDFIITVQMIFEESDKSLKFCKKLIGNLINTIEINNYLFKIDDTNKILLSIPKSLNKSYKDYIEIICKILDSMKPDDSEVLTIYTDGASRGNPGRAAWAYYIPQLNISEAGYNEIATNNQMELTAILSALVRVSSVSGLKYEKILIKSDSKYAVDTLSNWVYGWMKKGILKEKKNADIIYNIMFITKMLQSDEWVIEYEHVDGHSGIEGNEMADTLCNKAMDNVSSIDQWLSYPKEMAKYYISVMAKDSFEVSISDYGYIKVRQLPDSIMQEHSPSGQRLSNIMTFSRITGVKIDFE